MCFRAVKHLPPRQSYWLYLIHPVSCLPPIYIDYSSMSWLRSKMAAALPQCRCYSLIAIWDFSLCGALGLLCLWQMLSYVHELSYKPMLCFSPSSPLKVPIRMRGNLVWARPSGLKLFDHVQFHSMKCTLCTHLITRRLNLWRRVNYSNQSVNGWGWSVAA